MKLEAVDDLRMKISPENDEDYEFIGRMLSYLDGLTVAIVHDEKCKVKYLLVCPDMSGWVRTGA